MNYLIQNLQLLVSQLILNTMHFCLERKKKKGKVCALKEEDRLFPSIKHAKYLCTELGTCRKNYDGINDHIQVPQHMKINENHVDNCNIDIPLNYK